MEMVLITVCAIDALFLVQNFVSVNIRFVFGFANQPQAIFPHFTFNKDIYNLWRQPRHVILVYSEKVRKVFNTVNYIKRKYIPTPTQSKIHYCYFIKVMLYHFEKRVDMLIHVIFFENVEEIARPILTKIKTIPWSILQKELQPARLC